MSSPPNSIAQLLAFPAGSGPVASGTDETDPALLINYLQQGYNEREDRFDLDFPEPPASPPNPSVQIPAALANIPTPPNASYLVSIPTHLPDVPFVNHDRGEMGGKRRKQAHERAGYKEWKEIEESPATGRYKRRKEDYDFDDEGQHGQGQGQHAQGGHGQEHGHGGNGSHGHGSGLEDERIFPPGTGEITEPTGGEMPEDKAKRTKISKELRAEQNRKAQQIFRRKREQRIKQLEADSLALVGYKQRLSAAENKLVEMALELEAKTLESAGLRRTLAAVGAAGISVTKSDGNLVLEESEWEGRDEARFGVEATEAACDALAKASRELAKMNRQKREEQPNPQGMGQ